MFFRCVCVRAEDADKNYLCFPFLFIGHTFAAIVHTLLLECQSRSPSQEKGLQLTHGA